MKTVGSLFKVFIVIVFFTSSLIGCSKPVENHEFSLPEGDAESGQLVFVEYRCIECHTIAGTEFINDRELSDIDRERLVTIGGESTRVKSYSDLVTSIINPSHKLAKGYRIEDIIDENGESRMRNYNDELTVRELIDLVTFLKSKYELKSIPLTIYPYYIYPG